MSDLRGSTWRAHPVYPHVLQQLCVWVLHSDHGIEDLPAAHFIHQLLQVPILVGGNQQVICKQKQKHKQHTALTTITEE